MEQSIVFAKKYLEDLLSFFGLNTTVQATSDDGVIELDIPTTNLNGFLIGQHGETMRALQFLVSSALKNQNYEYVRVNVDVAEYKKHRAERLISRAGAWMQAVKDSGEPMELKPMSAVDRRVIHKLAQDSGIVSESIGDGRERRIILKSAEVAEDK